MKDVFDAQIPRGLKECESNGRDVLLMGEHELGAGEITFGEVVGDVRWFEVKVNLVGVLEQEERAPMPPGALHGKRLHVVHQLCACFHVSVFYVRPFKERRY